MAASNLPRVPEGLRDMMKNYTKEVLREKPINLYEFSSDYFNNIAIGTSQQRKVEKYEPPQSYETIMKNRMRNQVPLSLVYNIIPISLTELIKKFIKAVLRENPANLIQFAREYFQNLRDGQSTNIEYRKYAAYEKCMQTKVLNRDISSDTKVICECGRVLSSNESRKQVINLSTAPALENNNSIENNNSAQYLRAVYIIQKAFRQYLKRKRENIVKDSAVTTDKYKSQDYLNAIFIIQRQIRLYLVRKRSKNADKLRKTDSNKQYESVVYMKSVYVIQRYCRQYLKRKALNKSNRSEDNVSLTTAAFIIQRAFRRMVRARKSRKHINAELDQGDEINDNASEAASYTSASTALLSTESACEHNEFGGTNYEEGVHQQTIQEDEEVDNDNLNHQKEFVTESIKTSGKSIIFNENDLNSKNNSNEYLFEESGDENEVFIENENHINKDIELLKANIPNDDIKTMKVNNNYNPKKVVEDFIKAESMENSNEEPVTNNDEIIIKKRLQTTNAAQPKSLDSTLKDNSEQTDSVSENIIDSKDIESALEAEIMGSTSSRKGSTDTADTAIEFKQKPSAVETESIKGMNSEEIVVAELTATPEMDGTNDINQDQESKSKPELDSAGSSIKDQESKSKSVDSGENIATADKLRMESSSSSPNKSDEEIIIKHDLGSSIEATEQKGSTNEESVERTTSVSPAGELYSIEVNSLQEVLKNIQVKNNQAEEISNNEESATQSIAKETESEIPSESLASLELINPTTSLELINPTITDSNTESEENEKIISKISHSSDEPITNDDVDIGTSIIIHSVLPGEDDYELKLSSDKDEPVTENLQEVKGSNEEQSETLNISETNKDNQQSSSIETPEATQTENIHIKSEVDNLSKPALENVEPPAIKYDSETGETESLSTSMRSEIVEENRNIAEITADTKEDLEDAENKEAKNTEEKLVIKSEIVNTEVATVDDTISIDKPRDSELVSPKKPSEETEMESEIDEPVEQKTQVDLNSKSVNIKNEEMSTSEIEQNPESSQDEVNINMEISNSENGKLIEENSKANLELPNQPSSLTELDETNSEKNQNAEGIQTETRDIKENEEDSEIKPEIINLSNVSKELAGGVVENNENIKNINPETGSIDLIALNTENSQLSPTETLNPSTSSQDIEEADIEQKENILIETTELPILTENNMQISSEAIIPSTPPKEQENNEEVDMKLNLTSADNADETVANVSNIEDNQTILDNQPKRMETDPEMPADIDTQSQSEPQRIKRSTTEQSEDDKLVNENAVQDLNKNSTEIPTIETETKSNLLLNQKSNNGNEAKIEKSTSSDEIEENNSKSVNNNNSTIQEQPEIVEGSIEQKPQIDETIINDNKESVEIPKSPTIKSEETISAQNSKDVGNEPIEPSKTKPEESTKEYLELIEKQMVDEDETVEAVATKSIETSNEVDKDTPNRETKSSLLLSNQLIGTDMNTPITHKPKKLSNNKEKQVTNTDLGRLKNFPIAELQLKSFKLSPNEAGLWYEVPQENQVNPEQNKELLSEKGNIVSEEQQSAELRERTPRYIYGELLTTNEAPKQKQSIAYFISFDGNDGKTTYKIPKRFLKQAESNMNHKSSQKSNEMPKEGEYTEPLMQSEEVLDASDVQDVQVQKYSSQKLQTIHEINENDLHSGVEEEISKDANRDDKGNVEIEGQEEILSSEIIDITQDSNNDLSSAIEEQISKENNMENMEIDVQDEKDLLTQIIDSNKEYSNDLSRRIEEEILNEDNTKDSKENIEIDVQEEKVLSTEIIDSPQDANNILSCGIEEEILKNDNKDGEENVNIDVQGEKVLSIDIIGKEYIKDLNSGIGEKISKDNVKDHMEIDVQEEKVLSTEIIDSPQDANNILSCGIEEEILKNDNKDGEENAQEEKILPTEVINIKKVFNNDLSRGIDEEKSKDNNMENIEIDAQEDKVLSTEIIEEEKSKEYEIENIEIDVQDEKTLSTEIIDNTQDSNNILGIGIEEEILKNDNKDGEEYVEIAVHEEQISPAEVIDIKKVFNNDLSKGTEEVKPKNNNLDNIEVDVQEDKVLATEIIDNKKEDIEQEQSKNNKLESVEIDVQEEIVLSTEIIEEEKLKENNMENIEVDVQEDEVLSIENIDSTQGTNNILSSGIIEEELSKDDNKNREENVEIDVQEDKFLPTEIIEDEISKGVEEENILSSEVIDNKNNSHIERSEDEVDGTGEIRIDFDDPNQLDNLINNANDLKRMRGAQIIQRAYKNYLSRRPRLNPNSADEEANKDLPTATALTKSKTNLNQNLAAMTIQRVFRQYLSKMAKKIPTETTTNYSNAQLMAIIRIQNAFRNYLHRRQQQYSHSEDLTEDTSANSSLLTAIPNTSGLTTPDASPQRASIRTSRSSDAISMESESIATKPEWFVGNQRILLASSDESPVIESIERTTIKDLSAPLRNESTSNTQLESSTVDANSNGSLQTKLTSDIGSTISELIHNDNENENDNGASNNSAGSSRAVVSGLVKDLTDKAFAELDASPQGTSNRQVLNDFLSHEIEFSSKQDPHPNREPDEIHEDECVKKTVSLTYPEQDEPEKAAETLKEAVEKQVEVKVEGQDEKGPQKEAETPDKIDEKNIDESQLKEKEGANQLKEMEAENESEEKEDETEEEKEEEKEEESLASDTMDKATLKLMGPDAVIEKMSQRRSSETKEKLKDDFDITEPLFDEPIIRPMSLLQEQSSLDIEDGDIIVYNRLHRDETRESSAQSESVVFGNDEDERPPSNDVETAQRVQLSRHYTIAGEDPQSVFRTVTINESVKYIDNDKDDDDDDDITNLINGTSSFCLDDETSENIRKKMMAYSLSETDSDYYDPNKITNDDSHVDTAMTDVMDTSTETESTIVSAATKIQAGARGFLTRRRLRRASAGTKSSTLDTKASFGNDAISESLERFIEEEAAKKIQSAYRLHTKRTNKKPVNTATIKSGSLESSLAAKRLTLQRGDALRNDSNSTPEDEHSGSSKSGNSQKVTQSKSYNSNDGRSKRRLDLGLKWPAVRQNSMPVQIESEVLRVIPKHIRKRIKSAESNKRKYRK